MHISMHRSKPRQLPGIVPWLCISCFFSGNDTYNIYHCQQNPHGYSFPWFQKYYQPPRHPQSYTFHLWTRLHDSVLCPWKSGFQSRKLRPFVSLFYKAAGSILGVLKWYVSSQECRGGVREAWHRVRGEGHPIFNQNQTSVFPLCKNAHPKRLSWPLKTWNSFSTVMGSLSAIP